MKSTMGRIPFSVKNYARNNHQKPDDWDVQVAVPRPHSLVEFQNKESESCSVTKQPLETMSADVTSMQDVGYEYVPMDDKQECSSVSNPPTDNFETKFLSASHDCFIQKMPIARSQRFSEEITSDERVKMQHPTSSDSTVTEPTHQTAHECCMQMANEMICIQNQLSDIEIKQANMMHQLQVLYTCTYFLHSGAATHFPLCDGLLSIGFLVFLNSSSTIVLYVCLTCMLIMKAMN